MNVTRIEEAARGLSARDFAAFADRIAAINPTLGIVVRLHAEAEDGNSPDLTAWIQATAEEAEELTAKGIYGREEAARWWFARYLPGCPNDEMEADIRRLIGELR